MKDSRKARGSKKASRKNQQKIALVEKAQRSLDLEDWLTEIGNHAKAAVASGSLKGACLVPNPQTGGNDCIRTDEATCAKIGGTWIGGPCG